MIGDQDRVAVHLYLLPCCNLIGRFVSAPRPLEYERNQIFLIQPLVLSDCVGQRSNMTTGGGIKTDYSGTPKKTPP